MNTALAPSLGQTAQNLSNFVTPKLIKDGLWSMGESGIKSVADTISAVAPKLLTTNNTKFWGLGIKGAGLALAGAATVSLLSNVNDAAKNFAGAISYNTGSASLVKAGLDGAVALTALGTAFGKFNAVPALASLAASGIFKEYEKLAMNQSSLMEIPALSQLLRYQPSESGHYAYRTSKFSPSYDFFINADNKIRKWMGFDDYLLRDTYANGLENVRKVSTTATDQRPTANNLGVI
jgi:hypothetical protein